MLNNFATPMMQQYAEIKKSHADCIIFFRLGDFYEMFLEDAKTGAEVLDITLTSRDRGKDGRIPMAGVPYHAVDSYLPKLVKAGHKVAICEQVGTSDEGGLMKREIVRVVTPGTLMTENSLEKKENNYIFSLVCESQRDKVVLGLALADLSTGDFLVQEYFLDDKSSIKEILTEDVWRYSPSECILSRQDYDDPELLGVLKQDGQEGSLSVSFFEGASFYGDSAAKILEDHFDVVDLGGFGLSEKEVAQKAGALLLGYLASTQKSTLSHIDDVELLSKKGVVGLDHSTIHNLELFSQLSTGAKEGSLIVYLDKTITAMGGRLLRSWLRNPLLSRDVLENRYDAVDFFLARISLYEKLREGLGEIGDMERILSRLAVGVGNPVDLKSLETSLEKTLDIRNFFGDLLADGGADAISSSCAFVENIVYHVNLDLAGLTGFLDSTIQEDPPIDPKSGGLIKAGVDKELDSLREEISSSKEWLERLEETQKQETGIASLKVKFNKVYGYYIEVTKPNLGAVPDYYIRKQTMVGSERFITKELKDHEERVTAAEEKIHLLEYEIFEQAVSKVVSYSSKIKEASMAVAELDCILNFVLFSLEKHFKRPVLVETGSLEIVGGFHPVVEDLLEEGFFNPNNVCFPDKGPNLILLTGPNMSGKSVYIRQIGLIVLLAQIGCFVPAERVVLTPVDKIFVRSGASDNISSGVSTFMMEMLEASYILNNATAESLVIMDEVGRGTSTYDGVSLAWSIADYLATSIGCKTLFATHYHELCSLAEKYPHEVKNASVLVKKDSKGNPLFMHKVVDGSAEHSYGIFVAETAGIPKKVTWNARKILDDLESRGKQVSITID